MEYLGASTYKLICHLCVCVCVHVCLQSQFSRVQLFVTRWTVAHQAPSIYEILQARILEWVAMPSSRASS